MKKSFSLAIAGWALVLCCGTFAEASLTIVSFLGNTPQAGVNYVTFDTVVAGVAANTAGSADPLGSVGVSITPNAALVTGSVGGQYAAPQVFGGNGANFTPNPDGIDTTQYITAGSTGNTAGAKAEITFSSLQKYLGVLWGSVDDYNTLELFDGAVSVGVITGTDVIANPTGDQGPLGSRYVNIDSTLGFNRVVATSSQFAFEFDNVAYGASQVIPEATTIAVWSGLSLLGWVAYRRRSS